MMKCLQLGHGFKCEFCKCVNITLISLLLTQIIGLNYAIKLANETRKLTSVSNGINQRIIDSRSKSSYNSTNSTNPTEANINKNALKNPQFNTSKNSTNIRGNSSEVNNSSGITLNLNHQLEKHFYNITLPPNSSTKPSNTNGTLDEIDVSDSRNVARISRLDEDSDEGEQQQPQLPDDDNSVNGASSNLNEQKVVREITKILSKGMSGATDQVKLDTLEQWKRRQRERKIVKDSRAKLFEDLLTAAINTHPERVKKTRKRTVKQLEKDEHKSNQDSPSLLSSYPNLDPELSSDAETVIQHLQGLASVIDGQTPTFPPSTKLENGDPSSGSDEPPGDTYTNDIDSSMDEKGTKAKITSSSSDRPIVKQFKQIKNKISQRRKQLDQIKKIFNVDLSLNKDGSLQGKTSSSSKRNKDTAASEVNEFGEDSDEESLWSSKVRKKSAAPSQKKEKDKMQDLMSYLKENPEILASVMDELTASTEYNAKPISEGTNLFQSSEDNQLNYPSMSRKSYSALRPLEAENNNWDRAAYRRANRVSDLSNHDISNGLRRHKAKNSIDNFHNDEQILNPDNINGLVPVMPKQLSPEALLLEALRERQLMNLARLEKVLSERYQASNRSQVYSSSNRPSHTSNFSPRTQLLVSSQQSSPIDSRYEDIDNQRSVSSRSRVNNSLQNQRFYGPYNNTRPYSAGQSDEEVSHHYMVMNPSPHLNSDAELVDDSVSQQNQRVLKPYNQKIQQQQQHQLLQLQQQQLQQYPQLNRFRDWRDVSHSEASPSHQNDKTNVPNNITRIPFDLTTGGSTAPVELPIASSGLSNNHYKLSSFLRQSSTNDAKIETHSGTYSPVKNYADSVVTKPGPQSITNSFQHNYQQTSQPKSSLFMTRSSTIGGEQVTEPKNRISNGETDLDDGDIKSSKRVEITSSNDDENSAERTRKTINLDGPTDYFSAYKRTRQVLGSNYDKNNRQDTPTRTLNRKDKQHDSEEDPNESDNGDAGAMWAS